MAGEGSRYAHSAQSVTRSPGPSPAGPGRRTWRDWNSSIPERTDECHPGSSFSSSSSCGAGVGVAWSLVARPCPIPCHACKGFQGRRFPSRLFRSISLLAFLSPPPLSICRPAPAAPSIGTTAGLHIALTTTISRGLAHTHSTIPALSAGGREGGRASGPLVMD